MKKGFFLLPLLFSFGQAISGGALLEEPGKTEHYGLNGFYVGESLGVGNAELNGNVFTQLTTPNTVLGALDHRHISTNLFGAVNLASYTFELGYGHAWNRWYLGGLFRYDDFNAITNIVDQLDGPNPLNRRINDFSIFYRQRYQLSLAIKPGVYLDHKTLVYLMGGVTVVKAQVQQNFRYFESTIGVVSPIEIRSNRTYHDWGYMLGLGLNQQFAPHWAVGLSHAYSVNRNAHTTLAKQVGVIAFRATDRLDLYNDFVGLSLQYYFDNKAGASDAWSDNDRFTGLSAFVELGVNKTVVPMKKIMSRSIPSSLISVSDRLAEGNLITTYPMVGLGIGAGKTFNRFYLGVELSGRPIPQKTEVANGKLLGATTNLTFNTFEEFRFKETPWFDLAAKIGFLTSTNNLLYFTTGLALSKLQWSDKQTLFMSTVVVPSGKLTIFKNVSTKTAIGYLLGIGMTHAFTKRWSLTLLQTYRIYGRSSFSFRNHDRQNIPGLGDAATTLDGTYKAYDNQFSARVNYMFY